MNLYNFEKNLIENNVKNNMKKTNILNLLNFNWRSYIKFNKNTYSKMCVFRNKEYELLLITWLPKQHTKIHLHPKNGCIMKILYGKLNEIRIENDLNIKENSYDRNDIAFMCNDYGEHIISNINNKVAISLHLYSPPNFYNK